ncbi:MAG TPA: zinc-binding dehydrogenase [Streptosporangiaceae bacterium]|jgi:L-gulonate 5-dehydrogenase|nr:zinc-binding dehydrogenase [Streptosporangiaceae bacterium]
MLAAVTKSPGVMVIDDVAEPEPPGPIGLATTLAVTAAGARVMATDPVPGRRDLALAVGAETVAWGSDGELLEAVHAWTHREGPPRVIDTPGDPAALAQAARMVCSAGRVVVVGMSAAPAPLRSGVFPEKEIDVVGSSCATAPDFLAAVRLVQATGNQSPRFSRTASR